MCAMCVSFLSCKRKKKPWFCSRVAQLALVLGPGDHAESDPTVPAQSTDPAIQLDSSRKSTKSKSTCLAS